MRSTVKVKDLSEAQWRYIQNNVPVGGRDFLPGLPRLCAVFEGGFFGAGEFHVEMDMIELAGLLVTLAGMDLRNTAEAALAETPGKKEDHPLCTLNNCPEHG